MYIWIVGPSASAFVEYGYGYGLDMGMGDQPIGGDLVSGVIVMDTILRDMG